MGCSIIDSFRFRKMLARAHGVKVSQVEGVAIGEHGATQLSLFSSAKIDDWYIAVGDEVKQGSNLRRPDVLVIAAGATHTTFDIPGGGSSMVLMAEKRYKMPFVVGQNLIDF